MTFTFLTLPERGNKKRAQGITMVLDKGLSYSAAKSLMEACEWIDIIKLGWGTPLVCPKNSLKRKIRTYRENNIEVSNGGTLLELAYSQGKVDEFLTEAEKIGLTSIEVSSGKVNVPQEEKAAIIKRALAQGFEVYSEIGKKNPELDRALSLSARIKEARNDLEAGARKVILEARESGRLGIYDQTGKVREEFTQKLTAEIGLENLIFEAPEKNQQAWLILAFGSEVNLGNIKPEDVISLETLRQGLRGDTLGEVS